LIAILASTTIVSLAVAGFEITVFVTSFETLLASSLLPRFKKVEITE